MSWWQLRSHHAHVQGCASRVWVPRARTAGRLPETAKDLGSEGTVGKMNEVHGVTGLLAFMTASISLP